MLISTLSVGLRHSSGNFSRKSFFRSVHSGTRIEPGGNGCRYSSITVKTFKRYCKGKPLFPLKFLNEASLTSLKLKKVWTETISEDQARISATSFIEDSYRIIMYTALASLKRVMANGWKLEVDETIYWFQSLPVITKRIDICNSTSSFLVSN